MEEAHVTMTSLAWHKASYQVILRVPTYSAEAGMGMHVDGWHGHV